MTTPLHAFTIPYGDLVADNRHFIAIRIGRGARLALAPEYRAGKTALADLASAIAPPTPHVGPLAITGVLYPPDRRKRDVGNYRKIVTDALTGVLYADDSQLVGELWLRGPVRKGAACMEVSVYDATEIASLDALCAA